jgi:hypothetical protein
MQRQKKYSTITLDVPNKLNEHLSRSNQESHGWPLEAVLVYRGYIPRSLTHHIKVHPELQKHA